MLALGKTGSGIGGGLAAVLDFIIASLMRHNLNKTTNILFLIVSPCEEAANAPRQLMPVACTLWPMSE
jgi:hypothetical protein